MPTYEYECQECGHHFELFQSMSEQPVKQCPDCQGVVKRLLGTGAGLLFKGSGFYSTDYRSDSYKKGAESAKSEKSSAKTDKKSGSKTSSTKKASSKKKKSS